MGVWGLWEGHTQVLLRGVAVWGLPCSCPRRTMLSSLIFWYLSRCGDNRDRGGN